MSEDRSVLVPILLGCGLVGLLFLVVCGGGMVFFVPRMMQQAEQMAEQFGQEMVKMQLMESFPDDWRPPAADVADEQLFPESVGTYSLLESDTDVDLSDYGVNDLEGRHARYESAFNDIDVYAYPVPENEYKDVLQSVEAAIEANFTTHVQSSVSQSDYEAMYFSVSPPPTTGWLWWSEGWLFVFLTEGEDGPAMFPPDYLTAVQPPAPEEVTPAEEQAEGDASSSNSIGTGENDPPAPPMAEPLQSEEAVETAP